VASAIVRSWLALRDEAPRYFPDEYIYSALGHSIGHGHIAIRGVTAYFPALLEPILSAPAWAMFSTGTAYHLVQIENAVAASLACIPFYLLARQVGIRRGFSFGCAVYSVVIPSLVYVSFTTADAIAYPLAAAAMVAAVNSLDRPRPGRQISFLVFAALATFARLEYLAIFGGYLVAAALIERRRVFHAHWVVLAALSPAALAALAIGVSRILGYYSAILSLHLGSDVIRWFFQNIYLLTLQLGAVLIPGAVVALTRPRDRRERSFAIFVSAFSLLLLIEAAAYSAQGPGIFKERYLFVLLPLVPIAFGLYLKHGRPLRVIVIAIAALILIVAPEVPISTFTSETLRSSSAFLLGVGYLQDRIGVATTSFVVLATATVGAAAAMVIGMRRGGAAALVAVICLTTLTSAGAVAADISLSRRVRATLPTNLGWVDDVARGQVTAIATPSSPPTDLIGQMYWNQSIQREMILDNAAATDAFSAPRLRIDSTGGLEDVGGDLLIHDFGTTLRFANGRVIAKQRNFSLWRTRGTPRLRLLIENRYDTGWLARAGTIRVWPKAGARAVKFAFSLSLPRDWPRSVVRVKLGQREFAVDRGSSIRVACQSRRGALNVRFSSADFVIQGDFRPFSARLTLLNVTDTFRPRRPDAPSCSRQAG
jgi:hypothetical protein